MGAYRLRFMDAQEEAVRQLNIEADDDDAAVAYTFEQAMHFDMAVELSDGDRRVFRVTPMTARLYLLDRHGDGL